MCVHNRLSGPIQCKLHHAIAGRCVHHIEGDLLSPRCNRLAWVTSLCTTLFVKRCLYNPACKGRSCLQILQVTLESFLDLSLPIPKDLLEAKPSAPSSSRSSKDASPADQADTAAAASRAVKGRGKDGKEKAKGKGKGKQEEAGDDDEEAAEQLDKLVCEIEGAGSSGIGAGAASGKKEKLTPKVRWHHMMF